MLSALLLALALQSTAVDPASTVPPPVAAKPAKPAKGSPDEIVCRYEEETGSMLAKRKCHTRADWDAMTAASQEAMSRYSSQSRIGSGPRG